MVKELNSIKFPGLEDVYKIPAGGGGGTVTEADIENALGYKPIGADDVPVKKVNGATGEVKSAWYVTVTPTGSGYAATADKTAAEVYEAYTAGYAVYAVVKFANVAAPFELPLVAAASASGTIVLGFGALGSLNPTERPQYPTVAYTGTAWMAWLGTLARASDIPTIPTALKNPNALNIKIGNATTSYDGSAAKTVEIPEGGGTVTETDIENALGYKPIGAADVPVKSVNGQTGEAKTNWYFDVTGSVASPATTQKAAQIVAAQKAGFAPICSATFSDFQGLPATLPALLISDMICVFGGIGSTGGNTLGGNTFYLTVMIDGAGNLTAKTDDVAAKGDIPKIPTALKNPNALNIKIGNVTTSYDGSAAKTVEIPEGVPSVTTADNGKILRVVNGAWTAAELLSAGGASF